MTSNTDTVVARSATIIRRVRGDIASYREVGADFVTLSIRAFRFSDTAAVIGSGGFATPGAYILCNNRLAYIGESGNLAGRLPDHLTDASKSFATDVFVLAAFGTDDKFTLDKEAAKYFQGRLTAAAEAAGLVTVQRGVTPCAARLPTWRVESLDRILPEIYQYLFDAGCRVFDGAAASKPEVPPETVDAEGDEDGEDTGVLEVGVTTTPPGVQECELRYGNVWARGYDYEGRFIVAAGSEIRIEDSTSVIATIRERRAALLTSGATVELPGAVDRKRLTRAIRFKSRAIAGKVLTGVHIGSDKWRPLDPAAPIVMAL